MMPNKVLQNVISFYLALARTSCEYFARNLTHFILGLGLLQSQVIFITLTSLLT